MRLYIEMVQGRQSQMFVYYQGMSIPIYLGGGPFPTCPFSTITFSGKSPLSVLATLTGPLPYELEPVLGLGTGEAGGVFPPYLGSIGGKYNPPLCHADELGLLGGVGGTTAIGCILSFSVGEGVSSSTMCTVSPSSAA